MAGRIPQDFIDELVARADIVEVIGSRVQLKKAGREYKACCPFHGEKTPSFTVSPDKGFYHCFGCGEHGTALGFLMEFDRLPFVDAVEELAQQLGLEVPRDGPAEQRSPTAPIYEALGAAAKLYQQALGESQSAQQYLQKRGLKAETIKALRIGYAPPGWDFLLKRMGQTDESQKHLLSAGLIAARDSGGYYDRFRARVMFPIHDTRGRVVAFGGRIIDDGEPKYLNSPETVVFHKGRELYGLYEARQRARKLEQVLVVEGYMDVAGLAEHGVHNAVATLGTATTADHLRRLFRATPRIVFCFDGDRAGRDAAWRALENSLAEMRDGRQISFLFLPDGEDPDSLVRKEGADGLAARLGDALPLSDYLLQVLRGQTDTQSMDGRARLAELAKPLVARLPEGVYRELLTERLAAEVRLSSDRLDELLGHEPSSTRRTRPQAKPGAAQSSLVRKAIQLLVNHPPVADVPMPAGLESAEQKGAALLRELLALVAEHPQLTSAGLLERFRDRTEGPHLEKLLSEESLLDETAARREFADCLARIVGEHAQTRYEELVNKAAAGELSQAERDELRGAKRSPTGAGS